MCYFRPNQMCAYMWNWYLLLNARFFVSIFYTMNVCSDFLRRFLRFLNFFSCFFFCFFVFFFCFSFRFSFCFLRILVVGFFRDAFSLIRLMFPFRISSNESKTLWNVRDCTRFNSFESVKNKWFGKNDSDEMVRATRWVNLFKLYARNIYLNII